jgi:tRNA pseudouridine55 synthase
MQSQVWTILRCLGDKLLNKDGILLIDKPAGFTSHDVVARVRKLVGTRRVGHTGTLDPFATGLLVICLNRATRLVQFLTGEDKEYQAVARLGFATDTGDLTGQPLSAPSRDIQFTREELAAAASHLRGRLLQTPPMYSAKKVGGIKLYELARQGETVERQPVKVEIKELEISAPRTVTQAAAALLDVPFRVVCTSGTYVRVLAEDFGKQLGVGAHLIELRRTRVGRFSLTQACTLERLAELAQLGQAELRLTPMTAALSFPEIIVDEVGQRALEHGRALLRAGGADGTLAKLCNARGELLAVARYEAQAQVWQPRLVLAKPVNQVR